MKKVVIVTGVTSGIGREIALFFAENGCQVVGCGRREKEGEGLKKEHASIDFFPCDVSDESSVKILIDYTLKTYGRLDYAVNNAGIEGKLSSITEMEEADFDQVIGINAKGVWLLIKHQIPAMKRGGAIVNISSNLAHLTYAKSWCYSLSKAFVEKLTKLAAVEYGPQNIRVNAVAPGAIDTPMLQRIYSRDEIDDFGKATPLGKIGLERDIAETAFWLCSEEAKHITGNTIIADGGAVLK